MTIKQIAQQAGVAASTVSLVLNNKPGVRKEKREQIIPLLLANGYALRDEPVESSVRGEIKFLRFVASNHISERNHEFFTELLNGAEQESRERGYEFSYVNVTAADLPELLQSLSSRPNLIGSLLLASELGADNLAPLLQHKRPLVLLDSPLEFCPLNCINTDNVSGAYAAVRELYLAGHREIGFLRGTVEIGGMQSRYEGYCKAMEAFGLPLRPEYTVTVDPLISGATEQMRAQLARGLPLPTAYFACNDFIAAGCSSALRRHGCRIPEDISMIGFDDVQVSSYVNPPLTTMRIDRTRMAALGVKRLLELHAGDADAPLRSLLSTTLVRRQSIAPPAAAMQFTAP